MKKLIIIASFVMATMGFSDSAVSTVKECYIDFNGSNTGVWVNLTDHGSFHKKFTEGDLNQMGVANFIHATCLTAFTTGKRIEIGYPSSTDKNIKFIKIRD